MCSRTNYILYTYSRMFHNALVREAQHNTNHYLVLGYLRGDKPAAHLLYLRKRTRSPISPPATPDKADCMFDEILGAIPKPP